MLKRTSDPYLDGGRRPPAGAPAAPASTVDIVDIGELLRVARRRGPMVAMLGFLAGVIGLVYALQLTPIYTARATLLIDTRQANIIDAEAVVSGIGRDNSALESELELIRSYDVAKRVVEKLKLDQRSSPAVAEPSLFRLLRDRLLGSPPAVQPAAATDRKDQVIRAVSNSVQVDRKGWTYVVDVRYRDPNPAAAAAIANAFADEYLVDQLESRYEATRRANAWLSERLDALRAKVRASERAVELYKAEHNIVETEGTTLNDQQVAKLNEQLILARAETAQAQAKYDQIAAVRERGGDITAFADALQSSALATLKGKASEIRRELANLSAKYGNRHPAVVSARAQLADVQRSVDAEARRILASADNALRVAKSRERSISASLSEVQSSASEVDRAEIRLRELEREAAANKALFEAFLSRFKQTSEQEKLNTSNSRVIERASVPTVPTAPNKRSIVTFAVMFGLGLGAAVAFLIEHLDSGFRTSNQVETLLGVPVLANIPRADGELGGSRLRRLAGRFHPMALVNRLTGRRGWRQSGLGPRHRPGISRLAVDKPLSTFTEAIRSMRMGLRFADVDRPQKVVMLSSALPGEGKSTVASNLAQLAAGSGERVILVDLDLRHPVITMTYAPDATRGTVEVLTGDAELKDVIVSDTATGLHVLPSPRRRELTHTAELLGSQRLKDLLSHLAGYYDLVVIDTSPLLPVTDGRALIDAIDSLVMVVRWEKTERDAVETALRQSLGAQDKLTGVVLNDVIASRARYYDYYKSGYYTRKYPYYYGRS